MARALNWSNPHRNKVDPNRIAIVKAERLTTDAEHRVQDWKDRIEAGRPSASKTARLSGPVRVFSIEEIAAWEARQ